MFRKFLRRKVLALINSRSPDFVIGPVVSDPYLLRWWVIPRNRFFNIYIHAFLKDDDDRALHDHPWPSLSYMVQGFLHEHLEGGHTSGVFEGRLVFRRASMAHRLEVPYQEDVPVTIFITGPRVREWGFHCPKGWRHWKDFVAKDDHGSIGRGCGEME